MSYSARKFIHLLRFFAGDVPLAISVCYGVTPGGKGFVPNAKLQVLILSKSSLFFSISRLSLVRKSTSNLSGTS
ncbi:hypothetical protein E4U39_005768, partial [Claviceps sp. Clav50 group G5]